MDVRKKKLAKTLVHLGIILALSLVCLLFPFRGESFGVIGPVVDSIRFASDPFPGCTSLSISAIAISDPTTAIDSVHFTIIGVSARNLVKAGGFHTIPSQPAAIVSALATVIDENKDFISVFDESGLTTGIPGEFSITLSFNDVLPDDTAVFVVRAVAQYQLGGVSPEKTVLFCVD